MAILQVARMGHPVLRQLAAIVPSEEVATAEFQRFCDDLLESMYEQDGAGLAAPQVFVSKRVVVFELDEESGPMFVINPVVTPVGSETTTGYEGCLSLPDMRGMVRRFVSVRVSAVDRAGDPLVFVAHDWAARIVQHECDHLDGVLYIDRAEPKSMTFLKEFRRHGPPVKSDDDDEE